MASESASTAAEAKAPGLLSVLANLYLSPSEAFSAILKRPVFWVPLVLVMVLNATFTLVWLRKVDAVEFMKARIAESPRGMEQVPPEQRAEVIEQQAKFLPVMAATGPPFAGIFVVVLAALLTFIYRFFFAGEFTFKQALALTAWVLVAVGLVTLPLTLLVFHLKDDWTLNPQEVLQANPSVFVERSEVAKPVYSLLGSLDLFSFWMIALLGLGFGIASRTRFGSAIFGVGVLWAVYVLGKAALAAVF